MSIRLTTYEEAGQSLTLRQRGEVYDLLLGQVVLLSSAALETEHAFGKLVSTIGPSAPRSVLIGGLGFGATLRGALEVLPKDARVTVVEKLGTVERLVRGPLAHLATSRPGGNVLGDPRVTVVRDDVFDAIARARGLDAILLDVDNGPDWASFRQNARIYGAEGLRLARQALVPGGALAVWSGYPADGFLQPLRTAGFTPRIVPLHERGVVRARAYVGVAR